MEKVKVYVKISGDYCAFHEMMFSVIYDVTNNKQIGGYTLKQLENWDYNSYTDVQIRDAILVNGIYYVKW